MLLSMNVTEPTAWFEGPPEVRFKPTLQFLIVMDLYVQPTCCQYMAIRRVTQLSALAANWILCRRKSCKEEYTKGNWKESRLLTPVKSLIDGLLTIIERHVS